MGRLMVLVSLFLVACGGGRGKTACEALTDCCKSDLPSSVASSCAAYESSTDESACADALSSLQAASYCKGTATTSTSSSKSGAACSQYLSCLLATSPSSYAAALQLYGSDSACWSNSTQAAGCDSACTSAFVDIGSDCSCTGDTCTACGRPSARTYYQTSQNETACGSVQSVTVSSVAMDGTVTGMVQTNDGTYELSGTLACGQPSKLSATLPSGQGACVTSLVITVSPAASNGSIAVSWTGTLDPECTEGQTQSCTGSATLD